MILVLTLALLAPSLAHAGSFQDQDGKSWDIPTPPARYAGMTYSGYLEVIPKPAQHLLEICTRATGKTEPHGCAFIFADKCLIYVSTGLPAPFREAVEAHEIAHCLGWPGDHPVD